MVISWTLYETHTNYIHTEVNVKLRETSWSLVYFHSWRNMLLSQAHMPPLYNLCTAKLPYKEISLFLAVKF